MGLTLTSPPGSDGVSLSRPSLSWIVELRGRPVEGDAEGESRPHKLFCAPALAGPESGNRNRAVPPQSLKLKKTTRLKGSG